MRTANYADAIKCTAAEVIKDATAARTRLAEQLTDGHAIDASAYEAVMQADASAQPWQTVLRRAEKVTLAEAIASVREDAAEELLGYGERQSTSALQNEQDRLCRESLREFLRRSRGVVERLTKAAEAQVAGQQPTPASATPPAGRKPTKAQLATLQTIAAGGAKVREGHIGGGWRAEGPTGRLNARTVEACITQGWASRDVSTSLYRGQAITVTEAGRAHLPA
ncbi:hypothetical protein [Streptomyces sp. NPDC102437]|uniref:hypothetical protein n=1 Tax=Streptomyces sp. NPDC102437 TaxID=3366175 RepID=UPI0038177E46